ncbi:MAG: NAD(P)-dependent oxidoreductase [Actinomycetota bacterium]
MKVCFVGLGTMGLPMCGRLADAGFEVTGHDIHDGALARAGERGIRVADSVSAEDGGLVLTMLPDGNAVRGVVVDAALDGRLAPGTTVVDCSSSDPAATLATGQALAAHGVRLADAPVSGNPARADAGRLTLLVGGEDGTVARARRVLDALGTVHRVGPLGAGHALKALNNLLSSVNLAAAAEVMLVGRRFGLDPEVMLAALNASTGRSDATESKVGQFVLTRRFDSGFRLQLMVKDIAIACSLARATGTPLHLGEICRLMWERGLHELGPGADNVEMVRWMEREAGATLVSEESPQRGTAPLGTTGAQSSGGR